eukprot:scaffold682547_cov47-Prasinocladus_malaysianus.AAC.1
MKRNPKGASWKRLRQPKSESRQHHPPGVKHVAEYCCVVLLFSVKQETSSVAVLSRWTAKYRDHTLSCEKPRLKRALKWYGSRATARLYSSMAAVKLPCLRKA